MYLGFTSASAGPLGSEGDPGCMFFPLNTHQTTFVSDILWYNCRKWSLFSDTHTNEWTDERLNAGWTDKRGSRNSYLDRFLLFFMIILVYCTNVYFYPLKLTWVLNHRYCKQLPKLDLHDYQRYGHIAWLLHPKFWLCDQLSQMQNAGCQGQNQQIIPNFCVRIMWKPMYHVHWKKL